MKILLDECVPVDLRNHIPEHEFHSVTWAGFGGLKNGRLLRAAEEKKATTPCSRSTQGFPSNKTSGK